MTAADTLILALDNYIRSSPGEREGGWSYRKLRDALEPLFSEPTIEAAQYVWTAKEIEKLKEQRDMLLDLIGTVGFDSAVEQVKAWKARPRADKEETRSAKPGEVLPSIGILHTDLTVAWTERAEILEALEVTSTQAALAKIRGMKPRADEEKTREALCIALDLPLDHNWAALISHTRHIRERFESATRALQPETSRADRHFKTVTGIMASLGCDNDDGLAKRVASRIAALEAEVATAKASAQAAAGDAAACAQSRTATLGVLQEQITVLGDALGISEEKRCWGVFREEIERLREVEKDRQVLLNAHDAEDTGHAIHYLVKLGERVEEAETSVDKLQRQLEAIDVALGYGDKGVRNGAEVHEIERLKQQADTSVYHRKVCDALGEKLYNSHEVCEAILRLREAEKKNTATLDSAVAGAVGAAAKYRRDMTDALGIHPDGDPVASARELRDTMSQVRKHLEGLSSEGYEVGQLAAEAKDYRRILSLLDVDPIGIYTANDIVDRYAKALARVERLRYAEEIVAKLPRSAVGKHHVLPAKWRVISSGHVTSDDRTIHIRDGSVSFEYHASGETGAIGMPLVPLLVALADYERATKEGT